MVVHVNAETVSGSTTRREFNEQDCELLLLFQLFAVSQLTPEMYLLFCMYNVKISVSLDGRPEATKPSMSERSRMNLTHDVALMGATFRLIWGHYFISQISFLASCPLIRFNSFHSSYGPKARWEVTNSIC